MHCTDSHGAVAAVAAGSSEMLNFYFENVEINRIILQAEQKIVVCRRGSILRRILFAVAIQILDPS